MKSKPLKESKFQRKFLDRIKEIPSTWVTVKEAGSIRGLPDIIGCCKGIFFAFELKRDLAEASKQSGRIVLQRHILQQIEKAGGIGMIVHPDNAEEALDKLRSL